MHFGRKNIVDLVIEQVAPLLTHQDELTYLVVFFFNRQRQSFLPWSDQPATHWPNPAQGQFSRQAGTRPRFFRRVEKQDGDLHLRGKAASPPVPPSAPFLRVRDPSAPQSLHAGRVCHIGLDAPRPLNVTGKTTPRYTLTRLFVNTYFDAAAGQIVSRVLLVSKFFQPSPELLLARQQLSQCLSGGHAGPGLLRLNLLLHCVEFRQGLAAP